MSWKEFTTLLVGISPDTVLGRVVSIRAEDDKDILKNFTAEQKKMRNEWRAKHSRVMVSEAQAERAINSFEKIFLEMVGVKCDAES